VVITRQFLYQREMQDVNHVGTLLVNFIGDNLLQRDTNDVRRIIQNSLEQPDISLVSVLDTNKIVRFSSREGIIGKPNPFIDSGFDALNANHYYKTFPLHYDNHYLGFLQIGFSLAKIHQNLSAAFYRVLIIESLLFCAILFFAWRTTESLLRPLLEMKDVSNKIAGGNFSIRAKVSSHDSIGELAEALNNMALQLGDLTDNMKIRIQEATDDLKISNNRLLEKTRQLEQSNQKLRQLDQLKSDFVSMVSHELKTPLTSIIGFSKTLLSLSLPEQQRIKYLKIIEDEGKRLALLIEQYLDISKIEAGKFTMKNEEVEMISLVKESIERHRFRSDHSIALEAPPSVPLLRGDAEHLKRVIINLLDNACKYSPAGAKIMVSIGEQNGAVVVYVKDSGPGIKKEEMSRIFEKFFRGSNEISERNRGSGLGLAIAKGIVEAHKGGIWVESEYGKGAAFGFSIPLQKPDTVSPFHG
jgi:signal transduction histidine kinase